VSAKVEFFLLCQNSFFLFNARVDLFSHYLLNIAAN